MSCIAISCSLAGTSHLLSICLFLTSKTHSPKNYKGTPYQDDRYQGGPQKIPGRVQCAYYDRGGEGVAYHDSDAKNNGSGGLNPADGTYLNQFRMEDGVDISYTKFHDQIDNSQYDLFLPPEDQLYVGWTEPGEWFNITVQVERAGFYSADLLFTSNRGGTISLDLNGKDATRPLTIPTTFNAADPIAWRQWHHWSLAPRPGETAPSRRQKRSHRAHPHQRKHESRLFRLQAISIAKCEHGIFLRVPLCPSW